MGGVIMNTTVLERPNNKDNSGNSISVKLSFNAAGNGELGINWVCDKKVSIFTGNEILFYNSPTANKADSIQSITARGTSGSSSLPGNIKNMILKKEYVEARYYIETQVCGIAVENADNVPSFSTGIYDLNNGFPETEYINQRRSSTAKTGVCFSGGGSRALMLAMGQLRGLTELNLIDKIDYIASVSGGSWASSIYTYQNKFTDAELLGSGVVEPENITFSSLASSVPEMGTVALISNPNYFSYSLVKTWIDHYQNSDEKMTALWQQTVGKTYLENFGLYNSEQGLTNNFFTLTEDNKNTISEKNDIDPSNILTAHKSRPYLIMNGCVPNFDGNNPKSDYAFTGLEMTPLYSDVPYATNNGKITLSDGSSFQLGERNAVETFAYGGKAVSPSTDNRITTQHAKTTMGLAAAAGISSCFLGGTRALIDELIDIFTDGKVSAKSLTSQDLTSLEAALKGNSMLKGINVGDIAKALIALLNSASTNPTANLWSGINAENAIPQSHEFALADGGCIDNFGIMSLLRRKVQRIVVFVNTSDPLPIAKDGSITYENMTADINSLFGEKYILDTLVEASTDFSHNHVLVSSNDTIDGIPCNTYQDVVNQLVEKKKAGKAAVTTTRHLVKANDWWDINPVDNETVEICWVYNTDVKEWEDRLKDSQVIDALEKFKGNGEEPSFPQSNLYKVTALGYDSKEANLLGLFSSWIVAGENNKQSFIDILQYIVG